MMSKNEHVLYWKETAAADWKAVNALIKSGNYIHALFFSHLVLEKLIKAHWVKDNESNHPPKTHNLAYLRSNTKLVLTDEDKAFLEQMQKFQIEGRYPDYVSDIYKTYKAKQTKGIINHVTRIRKCILKSLS
jgi:HEPN domain-containing protein